MGLQVILIKKTSFMESKNLNSFKRNSYKCFITDMEEDAESLDEVKYKNKNIVQ